MTNPRSDSTRKRSTQGSQREPAYALAEQRRIRAHTRQFKDPKSRTGAYYQLSFTLDMKSRTDYIPRPYLEQVRCEVASYKRFKILTAAWVALSIQRSRLSIKLLREA